MRIQIEELKEHGLRLAFETRAEVFPVLRRMVDDGESEFVGPVRVRVKAVKVGDWVEVEGSLDTKARLTCGRCLTEFVAPLGGEFALTYTHGPDAETDGAEAREKELEASETGLIHFRGEEIDLTEAVQEQVILALPLRALCTQDCKGLCAGCGADLNHGACSCAPPVHNGPFAALRGIKLDKA